MERVPGIEPGYPAWKAGVLPLNYTRIWSGRRDSNPQLSPWQGDTLPLVALPLGDIPIWGERRDSNSQHPEPQSGARPTALRPPYGVPEGIRTPDPRLRRPLLYPAELQTHFSFYREAGDGNRTHVSSLEGWCSTIESLPH